MAAIDGAELGLELEDLEALIGDRPARKSATAVAAQALPSTSEMDAAAHSQTFPRSIGFRRFASILRQRTQTVAPLIAADAVALAASGMLAAVALHQIIPHAPMVLRPAAVVPGLMILAYALCGLYSALGMSPVLELRQLIQINSIGFIAAAVGGILAPPVPLWCLIAWVLSVGLVPFARANARRWCARREWWGHPTLVITSSSNADPLVVSLLRAPTSGFRPVAVTNPLGACRSTVIPVVNDKDALEELVHCRLIRYAILSAPDLPSSGIADLFERYSSLVPHLVVLSDSSDLPSLWGASRSCGRLNGMEMRNGRMLATLWVVKRAIDIAVASLALCCSFPLYVAIALAVKLTSHGPIFYGHSRIGMGGRWFMAWKFRTMHPNGDAVLQEYFKSHPEAREEWERDHKLRNDPRVTKIGKILRASSLDELPQVWNVLKGEMSLVGPRPIVASEVCKYGNVFKKYSAVKPGITGMWQVSGRSEISYDERVRLDEYYIANWSPWLDLYILAKTVIILTRRRGAY